MTRTLGAQLEDIIAELHAARAHKDNIDIVMTHLQNASMLSEGMRNDLHTVVSHYDKLRESAKDLTELWRAWGLIK